jgi:hypothetical protein
MQTHITSCCNEDETDTLLTGSQTYLSYALIENGADGENQISERVMALDT